MGYDHIIADDVDEAIEIAKQNPEFVFMSSAMIEVKPVKVIEPGTNFVYPR